MAYEKKIQITQKKAGKGKGGMKKKKHQNNKMLDLNSNYRFELNCQIPIDLANSNYPYYTRCKWISLIA